MLDSWRGDEKELEDNASVEKRYSRPAIFMPRPHTLINILCFPFQVVFYEWASSASAVKDAAKQRKALDDGDECTYVHITASDRELARATKARR
jgi:hypothetical protein